MTGPALGTAELHAATDRLLLEHGAFDPFEFLLRQGWLDYADVSAWQRGARPSLQAALLVPVATVLPVLEVAIRHARAQGLVREPRPAGPAALGDDPHWVLLCSGVLKRPANRPQGDLFHDNAALFVIEALRAALARHDRAASRALLQKLEQEAPREAPAFNILLQALDPPAAQSYDARSLQIEQQLTPAAQRLLGPAARAYLAPLWVALAQALERDAGVDDADAGDLRQHPSHAWMAAGHWRDAAASITDCGRDWSRSPALIARLAEIQARQHRIGEARRLRMRLCWLFPDAAAPLLDALPPDDPDTALQRRWPEFQLADAPLPITRFPAWLLLADARQREWLPPDQPPVTLAAADDQACFRALHQLLGNAGDLDTRRTLKALQPELMQAFLRLRERGGL
ncbi:MAG: hypothetical protein ACT6T0_13470 [Nevskia sp.]|uniref:hypothetical protein n=1 Tax=Nevskia sp. TaxID=1929292 RepID=UPI00403621BA